MSTPVPPSRPPGEPARRSPSVLYWPAIVAALAVAVLFVAGLLLVMKSRNVHDTTEQRAQVQETAPEPQREVADPELEHKLLPFGEPREFPDDSTEEVHRVLGDGMNDPMQRKLLEPVAPKEKTTSPPKPRPKEPPPSEPKPPPAQPPELKPPPKPPVAKPTTPDEVFEQRLHLTEAELRSQLQNVPEVRLFSDEEMQSLRDLEAKTAAAGGASGGADAVNYAFNVKVQLAFRQGAAKAGLPFQAGPQAQLDRTSAAVMQELSKQLRDMGFVSVPGVGSNVTSSTGAVSPVGGTTLAGGSPPQKVAAFKAWCKVNQVEKYRGALACMLQMLQVEDAATRLLLVRELKQVQGPVTSAVLAMRAVADLSPEVRDKALNALEKRPVAEYLPLLQLALRYPWTPVGDHAAYALVKLKPDGAVPKLLELLDQPDPSLPVLDKKTNKPMVKEMVRLNHLRNCLLCHPPSAHDKHGLVRGMVPTPGRVMQPGGYGAANTSGDFVRADITFLRQDFSVVLPVANAAPWPDEQRFDFITRVRPAKDKELSPTTVQAGSYPQREAVLYALRKLTGKDGGDSTAKWRDLLGSSQDKGEDKP